jgi:hypothetical protein
MPDNTIDSTAPLLPAPGPPPRGPEEAGPDDRLFGLSPEDIPNIDDLVIEDDEPVESIFAEKQERLLTEPLFSSWAGPGEGRPFLALANVGLFYQMGQAPLVPDVMLSLDVPPGRDLSRKENRSYLVWVIGKMPNVVIEFVSDRRGGEAGHKLRDYARIGVPYYVIFDPQERLGAGVVRVFGLREGAYEAVEPSWLPGVGLGLMLWEGVYEGFPGRWLRWCDRQGVVIPTGRERADQERLRADQERLRADQERERAEQERLRTEEQRQRAERLEAKLRALGIDPETEAPAGPG